MINSVRLYSAINLKTLKAVTRAALPSLLKAKSKHLQGFIYCTYLITLGTQEILGIFDVKGEATDASVSDSDIPA